MNTDRKRGNKLDQVVAGAQRQAMLREQDYRAKALKMYPWICERCTREFTRENLRELTVHHRDHDHDNNPRTAAIGNSCACTANMLERVLDRRGMRIGDGRTQTLPRNRPHR